VSRIGLKPEGAGIVDVELLVVSVEIMLLGCILVRAAQFVKNRWTWVVLRQLIMSLLI
jgi:hypothetical protein